MMVTGNFGMKRQVRTIFAIVGTFLFALANCPSHAQSACNFDLDGDGKFLATTDGLMLNRIASGMSGEQVTANALGNGATRTTFDQIYSFLTTNCRLALTNTATSEISPAAMSRTAISGEELFFDFTYRFEAELPDTARLRVSGLPGAVITSTRRPNGEWSVRAKWPTGLPLGAYAYAVTAEVCADATCAQIMFYSFAKANIAIKSVPTGWLARRGNAGQTAYMPVSFASIALQEKWTWTLPGTTGAQMSALTAHQGRIAVTSPADNFGTNPTVYAISESTGATLWSHLLAASNSATATMPTVLADRVFAPYYLSNANRLAAIDSTTGLRLSTIGSGAYSPNARPAIWKFGMLVHDQGAFDAATGATIWSSSQAYPVQAIDNRYYYSLDYSALIVSDLFSGTLVKQIPASNSWNQNVTSISTNRVLTSPISNSLGALTVVDVELGQVIWQSTNSYSTAAVRAGVIYAINYNYSASRLDALDAATGAVLWSWTLPATNYYPYSTAVSDTHVFVSFGSVTHAISLATRQSVWSTPNAGDLAITADKTLLIQSSNTIKAFSAN